jgi:hypothetical protein
MNTKLRGFSLLEAIVAVAIATAFLSALAVFTTNLGDARARLGKLVDRIECVDAVFTACDRAIATAVVEDPDLGSGITGEQMSIRIVRTTVGLGGDGAELLSDREIHELRFDEASRTIFLRRGEREDALPMPARALRIRYLASDGWVDSFDSAERGAFPVGIEVSIWFDLATPDDDPSAGVPPLGVADRTRLFRVMGAPRIDALARRAIRDDTNTSEAPQ